VGYGEHLIWPSSEAGATGAAFPIKSAQVRVVSVDEATALQPDPVASVMLIAIPLDGL
jgi:hypothetical protein